MDETCRLRRGEGYGVCADAVVSKCALTGEKEGGPSFPETSYLKFRFVFPAFVKGMLPAQTAQ